MWAFYVFHIGHAYVEQIAVTWETAIPSLACTPIASLWAFFIPSKLTSFDSNSLLQCN